MRVLLTSARFPFALDEVRKFGERGHTVYTTDTFSSAPGGRSKYVRERFITAAPAFEPQRFVADVARIVDSREIDLVIPCFEEVFHLAPRAEWAPAKLPIFCSPFEVISRLHDKRAFVELCRELSLAVPETLVATSRAELREATFAFREYLARPAFSRGGVAIVTNTGPLAGRGTIEGCDPSPRCPWIVQAFVHGVETCSFSVAHHGRVVAHCAYEHPKTIEHAGGITFASVDGDESLAIARRVVEATGYHGQISFDFVRTPRGLVLLECNPRPTAGVFMMESKDLVDAVIDPKDGPPVVVKPGVRAQIGVALLRDMFKNPRALPSDVKALFSGAQDVYVRRGDALPGLYSILSYSHVFSFRKRRGDGRRASTDLVAAQFFDVAWDGEAGVGSEGERAADEDVAA